MGLDLYEAYPEARARFEAADHLLGYKITDLKFGTDKDIEVAERHLKQTNVTQPALFVHSMAVMAVLEERGLAPDMVAGHSLGEYSALAAAGAISYEDGLEVVQLRGELMASADDDRPGTMAAVLGMDHDTVQDLCDEVNAQNGVLVQPANFNAPGQVVISGDVAAIDAFSDIAKNHGVRRVLPLPVGGAFHSPLMADAVDGLGEALRALPIQSPRCPVYLNVTASPTTDPAEIRERLLEQLTAPVQWAQALQQMQNDGAARFVEVGAGKVLSGLVRRTLGRDTDVVQAGTADDIEALRATA